MRGQTRRPKYLFGERGSPYEITLMLRDRIKKEMAALTPEALLKASPESIVEEIVQRYTLNVPVLDRNNIGEFEPAAIRLEVPQNSQFGLFAPAMATLSRAKFRMTRSF